MIMMSRWVLWKRWKHTGKPYYIGLLAFLFLIVMAKCFCSKGLAPSITARVCGRTPAAAIHAPEKKFCRQPPAGSMKKWDLQHLLKKRFILLTRHLLKMV